MPAWIQQREFYQAIEALKRGTAIKARFRQVGDIVQAGFLPKGSSGTCSFTSLDFHRAVSQGTEQEWMNLLDWKKRPFLSREWDERRDSFGRRQQIHYTDADSIINDPLFRRSLPPATKSTLNDSIVLNSRHNIYHQEGFSSTDLTSKITALLSRESDVSIRLNFDVVEKQKNGNAYGHTIALCQSKDGQTLYVMDPNAGVIATNQRELGDVLEALQFSLYKDYNLVQANLQIQDKFWLDPMNLPDREDLQMFREEEEMLLTRMTKEEYIDYQQKKAAEPVVDCDYDESIFNEEAWASAKPVTVAADKVDVSTLTAAAVAANLSNQVNVGDFRAASTLEPAVVEEHKQELARAHAADPTEAISGAIAAGHKYHNHMHDLRAQVVELSASAAIKPQVDDTDDWDVVSSSHLS